MSPLRPINSAYFKIYIAPLDVVSILEAMLGYMKKPGKTAVRPFFVFTKILIIKSKYKSFFSCLLLYSSDA